MTYLWSERKWDYAAWDKRGNPTICSRHFNFENIDIVINRQSVNVEFNNKIINIETVNVEFNNKIINIEKGVLTIDNNNDRIIICISKNKWNGIYVCMDYYKNWHIPRFMDESENIHHYYIMTKYAYNKERWSGINKDDIDEFYSTISKFKCLEIDFEDIVKDYDNKGEINLVKCIFCDA